MKIFIIYPKEYGCAINEYFNDLSFISNNFYSLTLKRFKCLSCLKESFKFDPPTNSISLQIPQLLDPTLLDCFEYLRIENLLEDK